VLSSAFVKRRAVLSETLIFSFEPIDERIEAANRLWPGVSNDSIELTRKIEDRSRRLDALSLIPPGMIATALYLGPFERSLKLLSLTRSWLLSIHILLRLFMAYY
jgi:hypothetical protein